MQINFVTNKQEHDREGKSYNCHGCAMRERERERESYNCHGSKLVLAVHVVLVDCPVVLVDFPVC